MIAETVVEHTMVALEIMLGTLEIAYTVEVFHDRARFAAECAVWTAVAHAAAKAWTHFVVA